MDILIELGKVLFGFMLGIGLLKTAELFDRNTSNTIPGPTRQTPTPPKAKKRKGNFFRNYTPN